LRRKRKGHSAEGKAHGVNVKIQMSNECQNPKSKGLIADG